MAEAITLRIDGTEVTVPAGSTLKEAAAAAGIDTPTLCHHPQFATGANCRVCVVEVEGARTLAPACTRKAAPGMVVHTDSERVRRARRVVLELLLGQADLSAAPAARAYAAYYGADARRWDQAEGPVARRRHQAEPGGANHRRDQAEPGGAAARRRDPIRDNPFFLRDYERCILCQRCTEACGVGVQHTFAIAVVGRGASATIATGGTGELPDSPCVFCGNCVGVCPTGALMPLAEAEAREQGEWPELRLHWTPRAGLKEVQG